MEMVGWLDDERVRAARRRPCKAKLAAAMAFAQRLARARPGRGAAPTSTRRPRPPRPTSRPSAQLRERVRNDPDMRQISYAAGAGRGGMREEMTARRARLHHGRGRRPLRRRLRRDPRPVQGVRRVARARHADLRGDHRRRGRRRGHGRHAARSPRSCTSTSPRWRWTRSPTRAPRTATCSAARPRVPMVIRTEGGAGRAIAAHHSQSLEALWTHFPGIYVVMPSTPYDAKGLLKAAIRDDNPVMFIEHKMLYKAEGPGARGGLHHPARRRRHQAPGQGRHPRHLLAHGATARWKPPRSWRRKASTSR